MAKRALTQWFQANLAKGCDPAQLKKLARKAGHKSADVSSAYSAARRVTGEVTVPSTFPLHLLAISVVLLLGIVTTYYVFFIATPSPSGTSLIDPSIVGDIAAGKVGFKQVESTAPLFMFGFVLIALVGLLYYRLWVHPIPGRPPGP